MSCMLCSVSAGKLNETSDPQELKDQVKRIFDEWIQISEDLPSDDSHDSFVAGLQQIGFLKVLPFSTDYSQCKAQKVCKRE